MNNREVWALLAVGAVIGAIIGFVFAAAAIPKWNADAAAKASVAAGLHDLTTEEKFNLEYAIPKLAPHIKFASITGSQIFLDEPRRNEDYTYIFVTTDLKAGVGDYARQQDIISTAIHHKLWEMSTVNWGTTIIVVNASSDFSAGVDRVTMVTPESLKNEFSHETASPSPSTSPSR